MAYTGSYTIFLFIGQAGNQLGFTILDKLFNQLKDYPDVLNQYFREKNNVNAEVNIHLNSNNCKRKRIARAVCIDTEPKVINECIHKTRTHNHWLYDDNNTLFSHGGAGNNWALGYNLEPIGATSKEFIKKILKSIKREMDYCHDNHYNTEKKSHSTNICNLILIHSVAGGTGSGLGTRITELCYEYFPNIIPNNLMSFLVPKYSSNDRNSNFSSDCSWNLIDDIICLSSHPSYKFLDIKTTPQTSNQSIEFTYDSWTSLLKTIQNMQLLGNISDIGISHRNLNSVSTNSPNSMATSNTTSNDSSTIRSLGSIVSLHGIDAKETAIILKNNYEKELSVPSHVLSPKFTQRSALLSNRQNNINQQIIFQDNYIQSHSILQSICGQLPIQINYSDFFVNDYQRSITVLSNGQSILPILNRSTRKATEMFKVGAYVHQYTNFGLELDDMHEAFWSVASIIQSYSDLP
eukprot:gene13340-17892_t